MRKEHRKIVREDFNVLNEMFDTLAEKQFKIDERERLEREAKEEAERCPTDVAGKAGSNRTGLDWIGLEGMVYVGYAVLAVLSWLCTAGLVVASITPSAAVSICSALPTSILYSFSLSVATQNNILCMPRHITTTPFHTTLQQPLQNTMRCDTMQGFRKDGHINL